MRHRAPLGVRNLRIVILNQKLVREKLRQKKYDAEKGAYEVQKGAKYEQI